MKNKKQAGLADDELAGRLVVVDEWIRQGDYMAAFDEFYDIRIDTPRAMLDEVSLRKLAIGLRSESTAEDAMPVMEEYADAYPETANPMRLRLALEELRINYDAETALEVLREVDRSTLTDALNDCFLKLTQAAKLIRQDG